MKAVISYISGEIRTIVNVHLVTYDSKGDMVIDWKDENGNNQWLTIWRGQKTIVEIKPF